MSTDPNEPEDRILTALSRIEGKQTDMGEHLARIETDEQWLVKGFETLSTDFKQHCHKSTDDAVKALQRDYNNLSKRDLVGEMVAWFLGVAALIRAFLWGGK